MSRSVDPKLLAIWRARFAEFDQCKLTVREFCDSIGCTPPTFYNWRRKLATTSSPSNANLDRSNFIPVSVRAQCTSTIRVRLPSGVRLSIPSNAINALNALLQYNQGGQ